MLNNIIIILNNNIYVNIYVKEHYFGRRLTKLMLIEINYVEEQNHST